MGKHVELEVAEVGLLAMEGCLALILVELLANELRIWAGVWWVVCQA
jgi:hypothetical protein